MMIITESQVVNFAVALGLGLLIGAEREKRKGDGSSRSPAGLRTFAISSLLGALSITIGDVGLLAVMAFCLAILSAMAYKTGLEQDPGLTTEISLLATLLLGGLSMREPALASGLGVTVSLLLISREPLHSFIKSVLSERELQDAFIFATAVLVILPLVPDQYLGPFQAINPRSIWKIVILVMSISAGGYILLRLLGPRYGIPIAGLASGFVSSAATISAMGARAAQEPRLVSVTVAGAVLSTVATVIQMMVILGATNHATLIALLPALICAGITATVYGSILTIKAFRHNTHDLTAGKSDQAFSLTTALFFALTVTAVTLTTATLQNWLGDKGVIVAAAVAGLVDTHSAAISVASLVATNKLGVHESVIPILVGLTTNTFTKVVLACASGHRGFIIRVVPGLLLVILAAWVGMFAQYVVDFRWLISRFLVD